MSYSPYAYSTATSTSLGLTKLGSNLSAAADGTITVSQNETFTALTATGQTSLAGAAGAEGLRVVPVTSAVNRIEIKGNITSNNPIVYATGTDSLVNLNFSSKGGTGMTFYGNSGANQLFTAAYTSDAVNWIQLANAATGGAVAISAQGSDSNVNLNLSALGTSGYVKVTNTVAASSTSTGALQVAGGIGANQIYGSTVFDNSNRVITTVTPTAGTGINVSSLTSGGPTASFTINNLGVTSITGTTNQVTASASTGSITLSLPQSIATTNTPQFAGLKLTGVFTVTNSLEVYTSPSISANAVTLDYTTGNTFALASNAANITANYTNIPTTTGQVIATALIITQGATAYIPSALTINTVSQTIKWQGGSPPTGNANKTDVVSFTFICNGTTTPTVIGSLSTYG